MAEQEAAQDKPRPVTGKEHEGKRVTFWRPTRCRICKDIIWGLVKQGYHCHICGMTFHKACWAKEGKTEKKCAPKPTKEKQGSGIASQPPVESATTSDKNAPTSVSISAEATTATQSPPINNLRISGKTSAPTSQQQPPQQAQAPVATPQPRPLDFQPGLPQFPTPPLAQSHPSGAVPVAPSPYYVQQFQPPAYGSPQPYQFSPIGPIAYQYPAKPYYSGPAPPPAQFIPGMPPQQYPVPTPVSHPSYPYPPPSPPYVHPGLPPGAMAPIGRTDPLENSYRIADSVLGRGAFSEVRTCIEIKTNTEFAVKKMQKTPDFSAAMMLDQEVKIMSKVRGNKHVVALQDVFENQWYYFIVMQKISGGELFKRISSMHHYQESQAKKYVTQILAGVAFLHENNIAHRDLKPENLLLSTTDDDAQIIITDFGLSKLLSHPDEEMFHPVGTPGFVAPELVMCMDEGRGYTKAVDLWAVGVIIYIMLSGYQPFSADNQRQMFNLIKRGYFEFRGGFSDLAKDLICKLMCMDPRQRWTATQAMQHPWFTSTLDSYLSDTLKPIRHFTVIEKWRKLVGRVIIMNHTLGKWSSVRQDSIRNSGKIAVH